MLQTPLESRIAPEVPQDELVLSVYMDTDPSTGPWREKLDRLRAMLDGCEAKLKTREAREAFRVARPWVEQHVREVYAEGKGLALFYAPKSGKSWSTPIQEHIHSRARFQEGPFVQPLADLLVSSPRYAIALVDNEHGRVIVAQAGEILSSQNIQDDVPKRHRQIEHDPRQERHHATHVQRHLRRVVDTLLSMKRDNAFDYLVIGGAAEALPKFAKDLPPELANVVRARFTSPNYANDTELVRAAIKAAEDKVATAKAAESVRRAA